MLVRVPCFILLCHLINLMIHTVCNIKRCMYTGLKINFCLFVLHLPIHFLPPTPKNYIAILWGELFDNLVGIQFLSNIFPANAHCLPILSIVEYIVATMNAKVQLCYQIYQMKQ